MRRSLLVPTVVCLLGAGAAVADEPADGTRPYMLDATVGLRGGDASGWQARMYVGYTLPDNLVPSRHDRSAFVGIGVQGGVGQLHAKTRAMDTWRGTWSVGPELRAGVSWGSRDRLDRYAYVAVSPMWTTLSAADDGGHVGARVAMGCALPAVRRAAPGAAGDMIMRSTDVGDFGSGSSGMAELALLGAIPLALLALVLPDTVEITYERAGGAEWVGAAVGYSL